MIEPALACCDLVLNDDSIRYAFSSRVAFVTHLPGNEHSRSFPHRGLKLDADNRISDREPTRGSKVGKAFDRTISRVESRSLIINLDLTGAQDFA